VPEEHARDGDRELHRAREVGLRGFSGAMALHERHVLVGSVRGAPEVNEPLQGAQLPRLVAPGVLLAEHLEERLGLERGGVFERLLDLVAVIGERVFARAPVPRRLHLRRELPRCDVLVGRLAVHAGLESGPADLAMFRHLFHQLPHLLVRHGAHSMALAQRTLTAPPRSATLVSEEV
jgi:hypothetical protein